MSCPICFKIDLTCFVQQKIFLIFSVIEARIVPLGSRSVLQTHRDCTQDLIELEKVCATIVFGLNFLKS